MNTVLNVATFGGMLKIFLQVLPIPLSETNRVFSPKCSITKRHDKRDCHRMARYCIQDFV